MSQDAFYMIDGVKYDRVSAICEVVSNASGDGLYFAGATDAAKGAARMVRDAMDGVPPCRDAENAIASGGSLSEWMENIDWLVFKIEASRIRQGYADRGTLVNELFDQLVEAPMLLKEAEQFIEDRIAQRKEEAKMAYREWKDAFDQGLTNEKTCPVRAYQCEIDDVIPYVHSLVNWWGEDTGIAAYHLQPTVKDEKLKVAGHPDFVGTFAGFAVVGDLKTSSSSQPNRYHQAQLAAYAKMAGFGGINIMVTPKGVSMRELKTTGMRRGWADFTNALKLYRNSSMAGSYESAAQTRRLAS